jgi:hypothetical protein
MFTREWVIDERRDVVRAHVGRLRRRTLQQFTIKSQRPPCAPRRRLPASCSQRRQARHGFHRRAATELGLASLPGPISRGLSSLLDVRAPLKAASAIARPIPSCTFLSKNGSSRSCGLDAAGSWTITAEREEHDPAMVDQNLAKASLGHMKTPFCCTKLRPPRGLTYSRQIRDKQ